MVGELSSEPGERSGRARGRARDCGRIHVPDDKFRASHAEPRGPRRQSGGYARVAPVGRSRVSHRRRRTIQLGLPPITKPVNSARAALPCQLAALLTSLPIFSSTAAVSLFTAKEVGQMSPSSRFAASWKPSVAYLDLNFCPLWTTQTTLLSLAYAGIPYQVFGESVSALALMTAWSRLAMPRSGSGISAIFASTSLSPSASPERARRRSLRVSFIAARSSSESNLDSLVLVLRADFFLSLMTTFLQLRGPSHWTGLMLGTDPVAR